MNTAQASGSEDNHNESDETRFVTRAELAQILKISIRSVDQMIADHEIPFIRRGKSVRFCLADVKEALKRNSQQGGNNQSEQKQ